MGGGFRTNGRPPYEKNGCYAVRPIGKCVVELANSFECDFLSFHPSNFQPSVMPYPVSRAGYLDVKKFKHTQTNFTMPYSFFAYVDDY